MAFYARKISSLLLSVAIEITQNKEISNENFEKCNNKWIKGFTEGLSLWKCNNLEPEHLAEIATTINFVPNKENIDDPTLLLILTEEEINDFCPQAMQGDSCLDEFNDKHVIININNEDALKSLLLLFARKIVDNKANNIMRVFKKTIHDFLRRYGQEGRRVKEPLTDKQRQLLYG
jgi:hypothetical protein